MTSALSRETWIGIAATALAVAAMAVDHLMGDDPPILEDPVAFAVSSSVCVLWTLALFGLVVPRTKAALDAAERAADQAVMFGVLAVGFLVLLWIGLPFVVAGSAIALGLLGRRSARGRRALAGVVLGVFVLAVGTVAYGVQFVDKLW